MERNPRGGQGFESHQTPFWGGNLMERNPRGRDNEHALVSPFFISSKKKKKRRFGIRAVQFINDKSSEKSCPPLFLLDLSSRPLRLFLCFVKDRNYNYIIMLFRTKFLKHNVIYVQLKIEFKLSKAVPEPHIYKLMGMNVGLHIRVQVAS